MLTFVKKKYASMKIKALHREHAMRATAKGMHHTADGLRASADWLDAKATVLEGKADQVEHARLIKQVRAQCANINITEVEVERLMAETIAEIYAPKA